ncbi:MAG TPA: hypothetical protein VNW68_02330, partial [Candidatus Limnocylindria bacterium]|nr:hypothetical protein [Candidatus Limnocylindria bacterium]
MPRTSRGAGGKKATAGRGGRRRHASRPGRSRIRWSRRIGVSLALLLLGGSIVLAGRSVLPEGGSDSGAGDPPPAPTLVEPAETRTAADSIAVEVRLPADLPAADYRVRIYVNEVAARERAVPDRNPFRVSGVALEPGENLLSAALVGPTGESLHSRPITIVRDSAPLAITLAVPAPPPMTAAEWRIAGQTEPAAGVRRQLELLAGRAVLDAD